MHYHFYSNPFPENGMVRELHCPSQIKNVYFKVCWYLTDKLYQFILHHLHIVKLVLKQDLENYVSPIM